MNQVLRVLITKVLIGHIRKLQKGYMILHVLCRGAIFIMFKNAYTKYSLEHLSKTTKT